MKTKVAGALANMALLLASCLVGLLLCEAGLRLLHPKYEHLAEAAFIRDPNLLAVRIPHHCGFKRHTDTDARHPLCHNNLGLRQHRDFSAADLESSVNIGFFGDSYLENTGMEAQASFTEALDYLLNLKRGEGGGGAFNVLNFGVAGYGTAQSLLRYELWGLRENLDHVFYVYYKNDLKDDFRSGLFRLDGAGRLAREEAAPSRFALLSKLHLTYLALDATGRLFTHLVEMAAEGEKFRRDRKKYWLRTRPKYKEQISRSAALFRQLLRRFREAVESNGASFHLVWLPMEDYDLPGVRAIVGEEGVATVNLWDCFGERDPAHPQTPWGSSPYRFVRDGHWNEAGNRLAAVCLHRFLEGLLGLPRLSEEEVAQALRLYYSAFDAPAEESLQPGSARRAPSHEGLAEDQPASLAAAIRRKYNALEKKDSLAPARDLETQWPPWTPSPDKLAIRSRFDVYLHDGWLAYVKEGCAPADFRMYFFLRVWPVDVRDLPPNRLARGFDNLDFQQDFDEAAEATCTAWRKLPSYAIERIKTGQFPIMDSSGSYQNHWQAEHVFSEG